MMSDCEVQEAVLVARGFQTQNRWHFSHHIKCITQHTSDAVLVCYNVGSENIASLCPYKPHKPRSKHSLPSNLSSMIYIKKFRISVASCPDLTLRIYSEHFELIDTVHITATVLSLAFNETTSELYTGGVGYINTWTLKHQLHNPLVPSKPFKHTIDKQQWVTSLDFDPCSDVLVATCHDAVYVIDTRSRSQTNSFVNTHKSSLTSSIFFHPLEYVITASKDGSLKVWNSILHHEMHTFTGHLKAVTGLKVHPNAPCVISCSLDGSIRTWHLENMTQCYFIDCGEPLLGMCADFPHGNRLASYSYHSLMMWQVHQVESHFASINSHVVMMSRVENFSLLSCGSTSARILALAEDGGVRLLSPSTGQVITILLPMSSSQLLSDVVYSLVDNLLFVLLKSSEVLVFNAATNPCSATQFWVTSSNRKLISIALCCVSLGKDGECCSLIFGGEISGHITLLFSSGNKLTMPYPCPAHDGHVTKLIGSCDLIIPFSEDLDPSAKVQSALISYGTDNMLNVWCLELGKSSQISLKLQMSIHTDFEPVFCTLLGSIICLSFQDNRVLMLTTPTSHRPNTGRIIATSHSLSRMSLLTHQPEDDHTGAILSLQCCPSLGLFATSSKDGHVKIWSMENHLVSEIDFGKSLASVCFADPGGNLLVGFQKHISLIQAKDYLPESLLQTSRNFLVKDCHIEQPIMFDSELEFWYDSERTPCLPAEQDVRLPHKSADIQGASLKFITGQGQSSMTSTVSEAEKAASARSLQSKVDSCLARELSQQYAAIVGVHQSRPTQKTVKCRKLHHTHDERDDMQHEGDTFTHSPTDTNGGSVCVAVPAVSSLPVIVINSSTSALRKNASTGHVANSLENYKRVSENPSGLIVNRENYDVGDVLSKAEVLRVLCPSTKFPIAPDCFIPNSVLRSKLRYKPPVVILTPYQPPNVRLKLLEMEKSKSHSLGISESYTSSFSAFGEDRYVDYSDCSSSHLQSESSRAVITCVSRMRDSSERRRKTASRQRSSRDSNNLHPDKSRLPRLVNTQSTMKVRPAMTSSVLPSVSDNKLYLGDKEFDGDDLHVKEEWHTQRKSPVQTSNGESRTNNIGVSKMDKGSERRHRKRSLLPQSKLLGHGGTAAQGSSLLEESPGARTCDYVHTRVKVKAHRRSLPLPTESGTDLSSSFSLEGVASRSHLRRGCSSVIFSGGSFGSANVTTNSESLGQCSAVQLDAVRTVVMQKVVNSSWYPRELLTHHNHSSDLQEVVSTLVSLTKNSTVPAFSEICSVLLELKKVGALTKKQKMAVASELSKKMSSSAVHKPLTVDVLGVLEEMGVGNKHVVLKILPLLVDPNVEVRYAAFSALRAITGVTNRSQLHQLLIKLGLLQDVSMNENDIMNGLADRVDKGLLELSPNSRILEVCRIGANFNFDGTLASGCSSTAASRDLSWNSSGYTPSKRRQQGVRRKDGHRRRRWTRYDQLDSLDPQTSTSPTERTVLHQQGGSRGSEDDVGKPTCRATLLGLLGEGVFSRSVPNGSLALTRNKVHELILQRPNDYSQTREAARMMLRTYGNDKAVEEMAEYEWMEIFPVFRRQSRCRLPIESRKPVSPLHPVVGLPDIDVNQKLTKKDLTVSCKSDNVPTINKDDHRYFHPDSNKIKPMKLQEAKSVSAFEAEHHLLKAEQHHGSTGLVVKLPQIANLRIAAQNS